MKSIFSIALQILIFALCGWYLAHDLDWTTFFSGLRAVPWQGVVGILALLSLDYLVMGLRLKYLVGTISYRVALAVEILGNGMNVLLPAKLGEVLKINALSQKAVLSASACTHFVFWSRFSELNILFILALCILNQSLTAFFIIIFLCWGALAALWIMPSRALALLEKIPFAKPKRFLTEFTEHLARRPAFLPRLMLYSAVVWLLYWLQYYWGLTWFMTKPLTFSQINFIFLAAAGVAAIPSTPGALGPYEAALVLLLTSFGAGKEEALIFSLSMRVFLYIFVAAVSLIIFTRWHLYAKNMPPPENAQAYPPT